MDPLLQISNLTVRYGGLLAVNDVSFNMAPGQFTGVIGPNGAGKTSFIDAVSGLTRSEGSIRFAGKELSQLPPHERTRAGIGRTFQSLELFEDLTVRQNLLCAAETAHWWSPIVDLCRPRPQVQAARAADEALEYLNLEHVAESSPLDLSLGQRKRVTVARALAASPKLLLLDEPAAGLDSNESLELGHELRALANQGVAILMVEHDMGLVLGVCDDVRVLEFGTLIASGSPSEIRANDRVITSYLGAASPSQERL